MGKGNTRKSKCTNSRDSNSSKDNDLLSWGSSLVPNCHVRHAPQLPNRRYRRKSYCIRNMKLQVTYYSDTKELQVEVSNRYVPGVNYDHRFRIAAPNTFDEMEAFIYMLSIFFGDYPIPREEWVSNYFPRQGSHEFQYRNTPVDFKTVADAPRRILFRGNLYQEMLPAYPPLDTAITHNPMGKGKGKSV